MRFSKSIGSVLVSILISVGIAQAFPAVDLTPLSLKDASAGGYAVSSSHNVSIPLFAELEEFARIVDIAYCVGVAGIYRPFECASRCHEFPGYELVDVCPVSIFCYSFLPLFFCSLHA
jgi:hypothetical protein